MKASQRNRQLGISLRLGALAGVLAVVMVSGSGCSKKKPTGVEGDRQQSEANSAGGASSDAKPSGAESGVPVPGGASSQGAAQGSGAGTPSGVVSPATSPSNGASVGGQGKSGASPTATGATAPSAPTAGVPAATIPGGSVTTAAAPSGASHPDGKVEAKPAAPVAPPAPQCFSVAFKHKSAAGHGSDEACSHHQNLLRLAHSDVNLSSVCLRVNGKPTRFQWVKGKHDELLFGAVAGPKANVVATYCLGKVKCMEDCKIPRDEFLDAIGGSEEGAPTAVGRWDAGSDAKQVAADEKLNNDLTKELAEIDEKNDVYKDWQKQEEAPACAALAKR